MRKTKKTNDLDNHIMATKKKVKFYSHKLGKEIKVLIVEIKTVDKEGKPKRILVKMPDGNIVEKRAVNVKFV
ncbi:hypothetical protein LCGC14_1753280 [marine sediment metagenome]|uniref:Uncharacterized protein n=1 Tax=marine sediment metagenome TaxID=412755 RepID=A0A0F9H380_9ZZZZ